MACLGEPSRFRLVQALIGGARCVSDLAAEVGLSQSCTTRHLQALERRNVVRGTRDGKRVLYRIRDDRTDLMPLIGWAMESRAVAGRPPRPAVRRPTIPGHGQVRPADPRGARNGPVARAAAPGPRPAAPVLQAAPSPGAAGPATDGRPVSVPAIAATDSDPPRPLRRRDTDLEDFLL